MKKVIKKFLTIFLISMMVMPVLQAQNEKTKKSKRQERKEMRLKASAQSRKHYFQILQNRLFVLQADQLYGRNGFSIPVSPSLNFFAIKGNKVIFQFGLDGWYSGPNGVGGITAEGFVGKYSVDPGKTEKKAMVVSGYIRPKGAGNWIPFRITVGNEGNANLYMNLPFGGSVSLNGRIVDYAHTSVFKGFTQF
jgi:hypothetical protein